MGGWGSRIVAWLTRQSWTQGVHIDPRITAPTARDRAQTSALGMDMDMPKSPAGDCTLGIPLDWNGPFTNAPSAGYSTWQTKSTEICGWVYACLTPGPSALTPPPLPGAYFLSLYGNPTYVATRGGPQPPGPV